MAKKKVTVRLKYGKSGFRFVIDGSVNEGKKSFYTTKRALVKGVRRAQDNDMRTFNVVDETGMTWRGNPIKAKK